ncbi:Flp family type IVb pilin [Desulfovibrio sp. JY]|nr:Flp family type IVb pilin [Desulfovibrio sp. JY]
MLRAITKFVRDEEGATAVEYGLMVALIAAVIVGVVSSLGQQLSTTFTTITEKIKPAG